MKRKRVEGGREPFQILKPLKQMNSNKGLNSNTQNNAPA
jgi:hypothetical protein